MPLRERNSSWADMLQLTRDEALQWVIWFTWSTDLLARLTEYLGSICWTGHPLLTCAVFGVYSAITCALQSSLPAKLSCVTSGHLISQEHHLHSSAFVITTDVLVHHGAGHALRYDVYLSVPMKQAGVLVVCTQLLLIMTDWAICHTCDHNLFSFKWKILFQV